MQKEIRLIAHGSYESTFACNGGMAECVAEVFGQEPDLRSFQQAEVIAADLAQIDSACGNSPTDGIGIVEAANRFFFYAKQSDLPGIRLNRVVPGGFGAGLPHIAQGLGQHLEFEPLAQRHHDETAFFHEEAQSRFQWKLAEVAQLRTPRFHFAWIGVKEREQAHFLLLSAKLLRHLVSYQSTKRVAANAIRSFRLHPANFPVVVFGHFCDVADAWALAIEALRLQCVERLVRSHMAGQIAE